MNTQYRNSNGQLVEFDGSIVVDKAGIWIWSNELEQNIAHHCKTEHDALLNAIDHLIFCVSMYKEDRDNLQRKLDTLQQAFKSVQDDE